VPEDESVSPLPSEDAQIPRLSANSLRCGGAHDRRQKRSFIDAAECAPAEEMASRELAWVTPTSLSSWFSFNAEVGQPVAAQQLELSAEVYLE
jgi:hypothetical protein